MNAAWANAAPLTVPDLRFGSAPLPEPSPGFDPAGDARALMLPGLPSPARVALPGRQFFGSLGPGRRFVLRIPQNWNGKLAVCGTPATRSEHANDAILSDFLLARGYAFASSNKGIPYNAVLEPFAQTPVPELAYRIPFPLGDAPPGTAAIRLGALVPRRIGVAQWHDDLADLTVAAQQLVAADTGRAPARTYALGLSIGGGQVRWLLENRPELVDGGVEWASVFWSARQNILTQLPAFLAHMPAYVASGYRDRAAHDAIVAAGFPPDRVQSEGAVRSLWDAHYASLPPHYADLTTFAFAKLLDPAAGPLATLEARAAYELSASGARAIDAFAQRGALARPLIGVAGEADVFVTPEHNAAPYLAAVRAAGRAGKYAQYVVADATHVDAFAAFGWGLQPLAPFAWAAFDRLVAHVEGGAPLGGAGLARRIKEPAEILAD
jgi:hypothetical protein